MKKRFVNRKVVRMAERRRPADYLRQEYRVSEWRACRVLMSLGPLSYGLLLVAGHWPEHTEELFSRGLHPFLVRAVSAPWRFLPISAA